MLSRSVGETEASYTWGTRSCLCTLNHSLCLIRSSSTYTHYTSRYFGCLCSFDVGVADLAWGRTGLYRTAAQCVGPGHSPGGTSALGDWGQGAVPGSEGSAAAAARPRPTSKGKTIPEVMEYSNTNHERHKDFCQWDKCPCFGAGQAIWDNTGFIPNSSKKYK